jgi:hypothetical protein
LDLDFLPLGSGSNAERDLFWGPHHTTLSLSLWLELRLFGEPRERERELGEININVLSLFYGREGERAKKYTHTHTARRHGEWDWDLGFGNRESGRRGPHRAALCAIYCLFLKLAVFIFEVLS